MPLTILSSPQMLAVYCRRVYDKGLTPATTGNISLREMERVYISPSGFCLGEVDPPDIVEMNLDGQKKPGKYEPSGEWIMHQALYQARPDINAIIHAHPTKATALAAAHRTIDQVLITDQVLHLGAIPLVPYEIPGTQALAHLLADHADEAKVMLLENHGAIALGKTIREAYFNLELLENLAETYILANSLPGGAKPLNRRQVKKLMDSKMGHSPGA